MKRTILLLFLSASFYGHAQEVERIIKTYCRSNPFITPFSSFLEHLVNDPTLENKKTHKRTDSTFFFFEGDYKTHRPFGITGSTRTHVVLSETQEQALDSGKAVVRTVFVYQLVGYSPPGENGMKEVKKIFDRFSKKHEERFANKTYKELTRDGKQAGEVRNFQLYPYLDFDHVTAAWANSDKGDNIFAITIRFVVSNNWASVPYMPGLIPVEQ
ncbi:MAG TPA: hypothetical protein VHM26_01335 [Chitinophagaceae bacterium]|jgi:hypothetical protein|nr:hypothetical protein [Chitinophagaceae bacterium]